MGMREFERISDRFSANQARVRVLLALYDVHDRGNFNGTPQKWPDLLRAAVVLLHATLEDLFRSIAVFRLPTGKADSLESIPFAGTEEGKRKFTLADLANYRGQTIDFFVTLSVKSYFDSTKVTYNNIRDLVQLVHKLDIDYTIPDDLKIRLTALMKRRHWIAHRADREPGDEVDRDARPREQAISLDEVTDWADDVSFLCEELFRKLSAIRK